MWKNLLLLLLLLAFCTAGCQNQAVEKTSGAAYQVVDSQGNVIKFAQKPQRIMTMRSVSRSSTLINRQYPIIARMMIGYFFIFHIAM